MTDRRRTVLSVPVDPESRRIDEMLTAYVEASPAVQAARLRYSVYKAVQRTGEALPILSAEHVAAVCDEEMWAAISSVRDDIGKWVAAVERHRPRRLRAVREAKK